MKFSDSGMLFRVVDLKGAEHPKLTYQETLQMMLEDNYIEVFPDGCENE